MGKLLDAVRGGDKRAILLALRDETAEAIENSASGRDIAALSKRLMEICDSIDAMPSPEDANPIDEMAALIAECDEYEDERLEDDD